MIQKKTETEFKKSLAGILFMLRKSFLGMVICGILLGGTAGVISKTLITPKYSAMSSLYIVSASDSVLKLADLEVGSSLTSDYIYLITGRPFITAMKEQLNLGPEYTYSRLSNMITVTNPSDTHSIEITTVAENEKLAADMCNALAEVSVTRLADIMESSHPKITEYAAVRGNMVSPNSTLNAIISFILGMIIFFIFSYMRSVSDDTIKSLEDIDSLLELNVLGMVNTAPAQKSYISRKNPGKKYSD